MEHRMAKIKKPDANPIIALLLTWLVLNSGHIIVNGQMKKWVMTLVAAFVGSLLCCLPGIVISLFSIIDAFQTAQRLQSGEEIDENEYTFVPLFKIMRIIDKSATCSKAGA